MVRDYRKKKSIDGPLLDVDEKGQVKVAFNKVNNKDHDGDVIVPSAYTKTLKESFDLIYHLTDHTWKWKDSFIAKPTALYLQNDYLVSEGKVDLKTNPHGAFMHARYLAGEVKNHSIGFYTIKEQKKDGYNEITELHLLEGSAVLWGANPDTPTFEAKSLTPEQKDEAISYLQKEIDSLYEGFKKYLKTGLQPEDTLFFGRRLEQLNSELKDLTKPSQDTLPGNEDEAEIKSILETFKF